jgi:hypothetical protein
MNYYMKYEVARNQYVGSCVSGHSRLGKGFEKSLPYFDCSLVDPIGKDQMMKMKDVNDWIKAHMPGAGGAALHVPLLYFKEIGLIIAFTLRMHFKLHNSD